MKAAYVNAVQKRLAAWEEELRTNAHDLAWAAPHVIARLKRIQPWSESFGAELARGGKIIDWGKVPE